MSEIIFITGGQRSGKSKYAQQLAEEYSASPVYLATAREWDDDFKKRIERHRSDRGNKWTTIEEEVNLSAIAPVSSVLVLDCITLWLTNIYTDNNFDTESSLGFAKNEWDLFIQKHNKIIVVSNELGMGIHPENESARKFADLQGWVNQYIASLSGTVILMVSGIPVKIK